MRYAISTSLVFLLAAAFMYGCGSDDNKGEGAEDSNPPETTPEGAQESSTEALRIPLDVDYSAKDVTLRWAAWGEDGEWVDATEYIRTQLDKSGVFTCRGAALVREVGDPGRRYANALILLFDTPGGPLKIGMNNTSWLRMNLQGPEIKPPGGPPNQPEIKRMNEYIGSGKSSGNQIVWARWGRSQFGDHWVDAHLVTQDLIATRGRVHNSTRGFPLDHPIKDRDKNLQVLISLGGQVMKCQMWGGWFELSPDEEAQASPFTSSPEQ